MAGCFPARAITAGNGLKNYLALLERVARLERELAAQRSAPPVQYVPPPVQYVQPPMDYYAPYYYPGVVYPAAVIVRPASRFFVRSAPGRSFVSRGFHRSHR